MKRIFSFLFVLASLQGLSQATVILPVQLDTGPNGVATRAKLRDDSIVHAAAIAAVTAGALPTQTGNAGKFLKTNGTSAGWTLSDSTVFDGTQFDVTGSLVHIKTNILGGSGSASNLTTPTVTATQTGATSVSLTLSNVSNRTGFRLWQSSNSGSTYTPLTTLAAGTTTYSVTGLTASTIYTFRAQAVDSNFIYLWSAFVTDTALTASSGGGGGGSAETLVFTSNNTDNGDGTYTGSGFGKANKYIPAGQDGMFYIRYTSQYDGILPGFAEINNATSYGDLKAGLFASGSDLFVRRSNSQFATTPTATTVTNNRYYGVRRRNSSSTPVYELVYSDDATTWTVIENISTTASYTYNGNLYLYFQMNGTGTFKIYGVGFQ